MNWSLSRPLETHTHAHRCTHMHIIIIIQYMCRNRRLKDARYSLVVTFGPLDCRVRGLNTDQDKKFKRDFCFMRTPCSASGTTTSGTRASPKPGDSPKK